VTIASGDRFAVVIATRDRPQHLSQLLDALDRQTDRDYEVVIVDQSGPPEPAIARRVEEDERLHLIADGGKGLSRARNLGWRGVGAEWVAYLDDDSVPSEDWAERLREELDAHAEADFVSGDVVASGAPSGDYVSVAEFRVPEPCIVSGRWARPWRVGYGVFMAVRRDTIERLGGWDERLGPGVPEFPASDDMDFNYRLMRSGGTAYLSPRLRVAHSQWRTRDDLLELYDGYGRAWGGFVTKLLRTGDLAGAALLTAGRLKGIGRRLVEGTRERSRLRLRLFAVELRAFVRGIAIGLRRSW